MRKTLLAMTATLMVATSALAQVWQKPVYNGAYQPLTPGAYTYIYNVDAKQFLTEGNDYGTHATVGDTGLLFTVEEYRAEADAEWDGKTYTILDYSIKKDGWENLFINAEGLYVDRASQEDYFFSFTDKGNNTYNIYGADLNPVYNTLDDKAHFLVGHYTLYRNAKDDIETGTGVIYGDTGADSEFEPGTFNTTWAFVSVDDYDAYKAKIDAYLKAEQLQTLIADAKALGVDAAEAEAAYANTSLTAEELQAAIDALNKKILQYYEQSVTPDNPKDLTDMIKNATCDGTSGWNNGIGATTWENANMSAGWQTDWEEGSFTDSYLNVWGASLEGSISQQFSGLPKGIYVFTVSALAEKEGASVFANMNFKDIPADSKGHIFKVTTNVTDGNLEIGIDQRTAGTNWLCMDNASLHYYGSGLDAYKHWLASLKDTTPDMSDAYLQKALVDEYNAILERVDAANTEEDILAIVKEYEDIIERINANVEAYDNLLTTIVKAENLQEKVNLYYAEKIGDYCMTVARPALEAYLLSTEEVNALNTELETLCEEAQQYLWNMEKLTAEVENAVAIYDQYNATCSPEADAAYVEFMSNYDTLDTDKLTADDVQAMLNTLYDIEFNLQKTTDPASDDNPVDYTAKIFNPSFSAGAEGWTNEGWNTFGNNKDNWAPAINEEGAISDDRLYLNLWNAGAARGYQYVAQLPAGAYTLTFGAYADAEGLQVSVNGQSIDIPVGTDEAGQNLRIYSIDFLVTEEMSYGANICISNVSDGALWAMVDEMHLYYKGTNSVIVTDIKTTLNPTISNNAPAIYTLNGVKQSSLSRGINIIRNADGNAIKIVK